MKRAPVPSILDLPRRLDELFEEVIFRRWPVPCVPAAAVREWIPDVDLHELADAYVVEVDLPGLTPDQVRIELGPQTITLSGQRLEPLPAGVISSRRERRHGSFRRLLELPMPIDVRRVEVSWREGLLRIQAPKARSVAADR